MQQEAVPEISSFHILYKNESNNNADIKHLIFLSNYEKRKI